MVAMCHNRRVHTHGSPFNPANWKPRAIGAGQMSALHTTFQHTPFPTCKKHWSHISTRSLRGQTWGVTVHA